MRLSEKETTSSGSIIANRIKMQKNMNTANELPDSTIKLNDLL